MAAEFEVTWDVIQYISGVTTEHTRAQSGVDQRLP
jgi:hypothetical protein